MLRSSLPRKMMKAMTTSSKDGIRGTSMRSTSFGSSKENGLQFILKQETRKIFLSLLLWPIVERLPCLGYRLRLQQHQHYWTMARCLSRHHFLTRHATVGLLQRRFQLIRQRQTRQYEDDRHLKRPRASRTVWQCARQGYQTKDAVSNSVGIRQISMLQ